MTYSIEQTYPLKPCPFCGSQPAWTIGAPGCAYIKCECGVETTDGSMSRIAGLWNSRVPPLFPPQAGVTEAMVEAALAAWDDHWPRKDAAVMRAALTAALSAQQGEGEA